MGLSRPFHREKDLGDSSMKEGELQAGWGLLGLGVTACVQRRSWGGTAVYHSPLASRSSSSNTINTRAGDTASTNKDSCTRDQARDDGRMYQISCYEHDFGLFCFAPFFFFFRRGDEIFFVLDMDEVFLTFVVFRSQISFEPLMCNYCAGN